MYSNKIKYEIDRILEGIEWKGFEDFVSQIFLEHNFKIERNFRFKFRKRNEIDILAYKLGKIFCVECKSWGRGRKKYYALKKACSLHFNRIKEFENFLKGNEILKRKLEIKRDFKIFGIIVTLFEEEIVKESNIYVVPLWKLNTFLLESDMI